MSLTISAARIVEESDSPLLAAPEAWPRKRLGDVATILNGFAFKSKQFVSEGGTPLIRIRDIRRTGTAVGFVGDYEERYIVRKGELLVGMDGDFNCARWAGPDALLNQRVCKITPDPELLDLNYLTAVLPGYLQAIHDFTSSTTVTHLSSRDLADIPLPLPSLAEQQALAVLADSASSTVGSATFHLASASRAIERFRQAVLAAAASGRLTARWREEHVGDARALAEDLLGRVARRRRAAPAPEVHWLGTDIPATWVPVTLSCLVEDIEAGKSVRAHGRPAGDTEWGVIKVSAMSWGRFLSEENKALPEETTFNPDYEIREGDLLISRANTVDLVGATVLVDTTRQRLLLSDKSLRLITAPGINRSWLNFALRAPRVREQFEERATGTSDSMRNLSQDKLLMTTLPLPPTEEQAEIARQVELLLEAADELISHVSATSKVVDRSFLALLAKAFRRELTGEAV